MHRSTHKLARALCLASVFALGACSSSSTGGATSFNIPKSKDLEAGGVYVAYNLGCEVGCDQVNKGDLIQKVDGRTVKTRADVGTLADNQPHKLELLANKTKQAKSVEIKATPKENLDPIKDAPPFWMVSAEQLNGAPQWARRRMFGHASPSIMLVSVDGGILDGRQLYGKKRLMVYWDWGDREEEATAADFLQVLQKAQADLNANNVEVMFVHVRFPTGRKEPMNDTDLRAWQKQWSVKLEDGSTLPKLPIYRFPNETEFNAARELGMEGAFTVFENLGSSPSIVLLDEGGIVMWHSEDIQPNAFAGVEDDKQGTIIAAIEYAKTLSSK